MSEGEHIPRQTRLYEREDSLVWVDLLEAHFYMRRPGVYKARNCEPKDSCLAECDLTWRSSEGQHLKLNIKKLLKEEAKKV